VSNIFSADVKKDLTTNFVISRRSGGQAGTIYDGIHHASALRKDKAGNNMS
jgi:hypothetical protein